MLLPLRLGTAPLINQEDPGLRLGRTPCCTEPVRTSRQPLGGASRLLRARIDLDHPRRFPASLHHDPVRRRAGRGHAPRHAHASRMAGEARPQAGRRGRGPNAARDRRRRQPE